MSTTVLVGKYIFFTATIVLSVVVLRGLSSVGSRRLHATGSGVVDRSAKSIHYNFNHPTSLP